MKKQKKSKALNFLSNSIKQTDKFELQAEFFPFTRSNSKVIPLSKGNWVDAYHKTECASPAESKSKKQKFFLPQIDSNQKLLPFSLGMQRKGLGVKTVKFLDSLINILKEQDDCSLKESVKRKLLTQESSCFQKRQRNKPKILQNKVTKQFFNKSQESRREVVSESCMRKMSRKTQPVQQYTFYGGTKPKLSLLKQTQFEQINNLNQLRKTKLSRK